jgi:hypothetical protein
MTEGIKGFAMRRFMRLHAPYQAVAGAQLQMSICTSVLLQKLKVVYIAAAH